MSNYKIENGISLPKNSCSTSLKYPFNKMEIGQSFLVPLGEDPTGMRIRTAASAYYRRHPDYRFRVSAVEGAGATGWRVWRVPVAVPAGSPPPAAVVDDDDDDQTDYERHKEAALAEMRAGK